jgi:hypothetical protein
VNGHREWIKSDGKGERLVFQGQGNVEVITVNDADKTIANVMHVPDISVNLLPASKLADI